MSILYASGRVATFAALCALLVGAAVLAPGASAGSGVTIVDTIAPVPLSTQFSVFGAGGPAILSTPSRLSAGPTFTLTSATTLDEVGGFINNCTAITAGIPNCPGTKPFFVEIHPVIGGQLQSNVVAQFALSHDNDPLIVSYESASPNITLPPGTYAALFVAQSGDAGFVLGTATTPFSFMAGSTQFAVIDGSNRYLTQAIAAVRIVGGLADTTAPVSTIAFPRNTTYNALAWRASAAGGRPEGPWGRASDPDSDVQVVEYSLRQASTGKYWTGSNWDGIAPVFLHATRTSEWYVPFSFDTFRVNGLYRLEVRASDPAGNVETAHGVTFAINR